MPLLLKNKRTYRKRRKKRTTLAKKVNNLSKFVYKTIEAKYVDQAPIDFGMQTLNAVSFLSFPLTDIPNATGVLDTERIGDKITVQSISPTLYFSNLTGTDYLRIIVVQWDDLDNYIPSLDIPSILQYPSNSVQGENIEPMISPYKVGAGKRFKILYDRLLTPQNQKQFTLAHTAVIANRVVKVNIKKKFKSTIKFLTGSNQTRPVQNGICMYVGTNSPNLLAGNMIRVGCMNRMKYRDA